MNKNKGEAERKEKDLCYFIDLKFILIMNHKNATSRYQKVEAAKVFNLRENNIAGEWTKKTREREERKGISFDTLLSRNVQ